jgi:putative oxidoreductase
MVNAKIISPTIELAGRALLASLFVLEGLNKLSNFEAAQTYMTAFGLPRQILPLAIAVELGGGILIVLGWQTRIAAFVLALFCATAAVIFHTKFGDGNQLIHFEKDLALAGAFLIVCARGAGRYSVDAMELMPTARGKSAPGTKPT